MNTFFLGGGGDFSCGKFPMERKVSRSLNFSGKFYTEFKFARVPLRNSSYVLLSLCQLYFTCGNVKVIIIGTFSLGLNSLENTSVGRRDIPVEVDPDFLAN